MSLIYLPCIAGPMASQAGVGYDPYIAHVAMLWHAENNLNNSAYAASGLGVSAWTPFIAHAPTYQTSPVKFGTYSAHLTLSSDGCSVDNAAYSVGTAAYTLEFWVYLANVTTRQNLVDMRTTASGNQMSPVIYVLSGKIVVFIANADRITSGASAISTNTWTNICLCRDGSTNNRLFINGTQAGSTYTDTNNGTAHTLTVPSSNAIGGPAGSNVDELRLTTGIARYTGNYTVATAAFPNV